MDELKTLRLTLYFGGAVHIMLGLWSLTYPAEALLGLAFWIGVGACMNGLNYLVPCLSMRGNSAFDPATRDGNSNTALCGGSEMYPWWFLALGLLDIVLGIVMLTQIGVTALMLPLILAAWMALTAVVRVGTAFRLRRLGLRRWKMMLLSALVMLAAAAVMFSSPMIGVVSVAVLTGAALISSGAAMFAEGRIIFASRHD